MTVSGCYKKMSGFSHVLKILKYDGLQENKKLSDENQRFD